MNRIIYSVSLFLLSINAATLGFAETKDPGHFKFSYFGNEIEMTEVTSSNDTLKQGKLAKDTLIEIDGNSLILEAGADLKYGVSGSAVLESTLKQIAAWDFAKAGA